MYISRYCEIFVSVWKYRLSIFLHFTVSCRFCFSKRERNDRNDAFLLKGANGFGIVKNCLGSHWISRVLCQALIKTYFRLVCQESSKDLQYSQREHTFAIVVCCCFGHVRFLVMGCGKSWISESHIRRSSRGCGDLLSPTTHHHLKARRVITWDWRQNYLLLSSS